MQCLTRLVPIPFLAALTLPILPLNSPAADPSERPNILFLFADDWGRYASCYAAIEGRPTPNAALQTPHLDRLAREGVLFQNAFVPAPSCTPCRSSLLSGRYFFRTGLGAILQGAVWDDSIPSFPLRLRNSGYHIGETWKVWVPGTPVDAPYGAGRYAYEKAGRRFNQFSQEATRRMREGHTFQEAKEALLDEVRGNFDAFLADRKPGQPFCYWFGPTHTHRRWVKGSGKALWGIDPDALKGRLPRFLPDVPEVREDLADYLGEVRAWDEAIGVLLRRLESICELERTVIVASGDHGAPGFPGGKCNLTTFGTGVALIVRMPALPTGSPVARGRVVKDLVNLMDLAPTFLEAGGVKPPDGIAGRSLWPLLQSDKSGQVDPERTWVITGRERHVAEARDGQLPYPQRALRTHDFLYIRNFKPDRWPMGAPGPVTALEAPDPETLESNTRAAFADLDASPTKAWLIGRRNDPEWQWHYDYAFGKRPGEELYDLRKDPDEVNNVALDPAYASVREEMAGRLIRELEAAGDPRVAGSGDTFDRPPYAGPTTGR